MTAGFHTLCADTEIMSPIGLGYEMKAWEGIVSQLCSAGSRAEEWNESGNSLLGWDSDGLPKSFFFLSSLSDTEQATDEWEESRKMLPLKVGSLY